MCFVRYYTTDFDWNHNVVTIKQSDPLLKFDKWWLSKPMCIEGRFVKTHKATSLQILFLQIHSIWTTIWVEEFPAEVSGCTYCR